jgi:hypothetical protein
MNSGQSMRRPGRGRQARIATRDYARLWPKAHVATKKFECG